MQFLPRAIGKRLPRDADRWWQDGMTAAAADDLDRAADLGDRSIEAQSLAKQLREQVTA